MEDPAEAAEGGVQGPGGAPTAAGALTRLRKDGVRLTHNHSAPDIMSLAGQGHGDTRTEMEGPEERKSGVPGKPIQELEMSFIRSRLSQMAVQNERNQNEKGGKRRESQRILRRQSINDLMISTEIAASGPAFIPTESGGSSPESVRSTTAGANIHPGGGRQIWVPYHHQMVLYEGLLANGKCIVCRDRVNPVAKVFRCVRTSMHAWRGLQAGAYAANASTSAHVDHALAHAATRGTRRL